MSFKVQLQCSKEQKHKKELLVTQPGVCGWAQMVQHIVKELALISVLHHSRRARSFTSVHQHRLEL